MATIKFNGFDKMKKDLKKMQKGAEELGRKKSVSFGELFTPAFMRKYTKFTSLESFFDAGGFNAETQEAFDAITEADLDKHVAGATKFRNWEEMLQTATDEYITKKLGF